ncbi:hypothetical protein AB0M61_48495 [Streptomyces sp. NPDC051642]|uniref:hypothetical protein n=1 Tax=Streptomyces sp. NPDC051642 TaxID=3154646 RepID=UPI00342A8075
MSLTNEDFVRARLATWQRRIHETAAALVPPATSGVEAFVPVLDQLVAVYNLSSGLVADLRQSADSTLAKTGVGREYLAQLAAALAQSNGAATHLSTAVTGLADIHRLTPPRPGAAAPVEARLAVTLGHAAALRGLKRALEAVTSSPAGAENTSGPSAIPVAGQHSRAADAGGTHPTRRRP